MNAGTAPSAPPSRRVSLATSSGVLALLFLALLLVPDSREWTLARALEALVDAAVATVLFQAVRGRRLFAATLLFLALPHFFFAIGWLRPLFAWPLVVLLLVALARALRVAPSLAPSASDAAATESVDESPTVASLLAFALVVVWVHLSGAGGFGYQMDDYELHNGRLLDLIGRRWPVRYARDQNLVFYVGYHLPAALVGKLFGAALATKTLYLWTIAGVWLAMQWLARVCGRRLTALLVGGFALFGGFDVVAYWFAAHRLAPTSGWPLVPSDVDALCFWNETAFHRFVGNFLPSTLQLFWSPHQVVAGWIVGASVTWLFWRRRFESAIFVHALLFLWSPLIALGLLPLLAFFAIAVAVQRGRARELFTFQNVVAPAALLFVFGVYYASGSAFHNPVAFLPAIVTHEQLPFLLVMEVAGWGVSALVVAFALRSFDAARRRTFVALVVNLVAVSCVVYGAFSDLFCRTSAPLLLLLFALLVRAIARFPRPARVALVLPFVLLASVASLVQLHTSIARFGDVRTPRSVPDSPSAYENLGRDDTFFQRHLAKERGD